MTVPPFVSDPAVMQAFKNVTHVYTDLDGTLFAPGGRLLAAHDGSPSVAAAESLVALKRASIEVIIVTGRDCRQGQEITRILDLFTYIGELGCVIQEGYGSTATLSYALGDWQQMVLVDGCAPGELPVGVLPVDLITQSGIIQRLIEAFPGKLELHNPYKSVREVTLMLCGYIDIACAERILDEGPLPLQLLDNGVIHPKNHTLVDCPEIHIYHILPRGAGKGSAVAADMARRGLVRAQAVAVGDAMGDMAMGEYTGSFVLINGGSVEKVLERYTASRQGMSLEYGALFTTQGRTTDGFVEFTHALLAAK